MKKKHIILIFLLFIYAKHEVYAQCSSSFPSCSLTTVTKPRVLIVDQFLVAANPSQGIDGGVNKTLTILGNDQATPLQYDLEDDLLDYAVAHDFTELLLYDVEKVLKFPNRNWDNDTQYPTYLQHFIRFVAKAKSSPYNLTVGVFVASSERGVDAGEYTGIDVSWENYPCALIDPGQSFAGVNGNWDELGGGSYSRGDEEPDPEEPPAEPDPEPSEDVKRVEWTYDLIKRIHNYNNCWVHNPEDIGVCDVNTLSTCTPTGAEIDRIALEIEWWSSEYPDHDAGWEFHKFALQTLYACVKPFALCPLYIDDYIGWLDNDNYDDVEQTEELENHSDRLYVHSYVCDPEDLYAWGAGRLNEIGSNTVAHSEKYMMFSAESTSNGQGNDFLGDFLNSGGKFACCEDEFDWRFQTYTSADFDIEGYAWFTSSFMMANNFARKAANTKANNESFNTINIYPNPVKNILNIMLPTYELFNISLINSLGKKVYSSYEVKNVVTVDISNLPSGIYTMRLESENGESSVQKIVKN